MRRLGLTALTPLVAAALTGASFGSQELATPKSPQLARPKTLVRVKSCSLEHHSAVFYARMRRVRGTARMRMRFTLLERAEGETHYTRVRVPGLSRWRKSSQGMRPFGFSQKVRGLDDGSAYRMRVRYRWYDQDNALLRASQRTSRVCRMYAPRPNLQVQILDASRYGSTWRYRVRVVNAGEAAADGVPVQLWLDGAVAYRQTIQHLDPGEAQRRGFYGPACGHRYTAVVDPDGAISESNETDNTATAACPPVG